MKHLAAITLGGMLMFAPVLPAAPKNPTLPPDETQLTQEVRHHLMSLPYYSVFDDLGFSIEGNTVVLQGEVTRPVLKSDAENSVKKIEGVGNVVNNIEVLPLSPNDDRIRRAMYRAIYGDPDLSVRYAAQPFPPIHIIVKNGNVRLEGVVGSQMDKTLAGMQANGVPGAFSVENDLQVEGK
jgi:hyperosmotically inducible periplasmic protein